MRIRVSFICAGLAALAACGEKQSTDSGAPPEPVAGPAASAAAAEPASPAEMGRRQFGQCAVCHAVTPPEIPSPAGQIGPNLFGVYGREAASVEGFNYSSALRGSGIVWDEASLDAFLLNPQQFAPGNRMAFAGERNDERRAAIIEYLKTLK